MALIASTLKAMLVEKGFGLEAIGFFSLVTLPYTLKLLFAPIIDSCAVPYLTKKIGQRRSWLVLTQIMLVISIFLLGMAGASGSVTIIACCALLVGFASASQDIVIDGYRIELIEKDNQGIAAGFYVYGYRVALLISGAGSLLLAEFFSWELVYAAMAGFMITGIVTTLCAPETRPNWKSKINLNKPLVEIAAAWMKNSIITPLADFTKRASWQLILGFVVCFKLCDAFAGSLTLPFLLDLGFSKIEIASIVKTFGLFATLLGVLLGGLMVKKLGNGISLWIAAIAQMLSNFAFSYLAVAGHSSSALYGVVFIENLSGGIGDAVFVAYLSSLCNVAFSATQYALLISLATVTRSFISSSAGIAAAYLGWYSFFIFSAFLALPALVILALLQYKTKAVSKN